MLKCTYIILVHNNQENIPNLVDSIRKMEGDFRSEFIFVDDGSTDNSLNKIKASVNDIPRSTIITHDMQGSTVSVNKAISIATGDYVHFVDGREILYPHSTKTLMEACASMGTEVAIGLVSVGSRVNAKSTGTTQIISSPVNKILSDRLSVLGNVGKSGSLVRTDLLEKVGKADSGIYSHNISLALRCAKYTNFALIEDYVTYVKDEDFTRDDKFDSYNRLKAIRNFVTENPEIATKLTSPLLKALSQEACKKSDRALYNLKGISHKYLKSISLEKILAFYSQELERLF